MHMKSNVDLFYASLFCQKAAMKKIMDEMVAKFDATTIFSTVSIEFCWFDLTLKFILTFKSSSKDRFRRLEQSAGLSPAFSVQSKLNVRVHSDPKYEIFR